VVKQRKKQESIPKTLEVRLPALASRPSSDGHSQDRALTFSSHSYEALPIRLAELAARREQM
jgi:hypothetical protein